MQKLKIIRQAADLMFWSLSFEQKCTITDTIQSHSFHQLHSPKIIADGSVVERLNDVMFLSLKYDIKVLEFL